MHRSDSMPSERRRTCALRLLNACWVCLGPGMENLREVFYRDLEEIAEEGRICGVLCSFLEKFYFCFPYDTQDIEGKNSNIRRRAWIIRALTFSRMAKKMTGGERRGGENRRMARESLLPAE